MMRQIRESLIGCLVTLPSNPHLLHVISSSHEICFPVSTSESLQFFCTGLPFLSTSEYYAYWASGNTVSIDGSLGEE